MKNPAIKKKLLLESLIIIIVLGVLGGLLYFLISWHDDKERENRKVRTQVTSLKNEVLSLDNKYTTWRQNNTLYEEALEKKNSNELTVSRPAIRKFFTRYNKDFTLKNVSLQMQPLQQIKEAAYNKPTVRMVYSDVSIEFDALTDLDVFRLVQAMQKEFPGKIKILSVDVAKKKRVSKEAIREIVRRGTVDMVHATVRFLWLGIEPIETDGKAGGTP